MDDSHMKTKPQATRATPSQIRLHIVRQRFLGELIIGSERGPSRWDLMTSALCLAALITLGV
jgi:hypothetical protein